MGYQSAYDIRWPAPAYSKDLNYFTHAFGVTWAANSSKKHTGLDIGIPAGTSVYATQGGVVEGIGDLGSGWGNYVVLSHDDNKWTSGYLHVTPLVSLGQTVSKGQKIAEVQDILPNPIHLHFSIRDAPYDSKSMRGALWKTSSDASTDWRGDPVYPEYFCDPLFFKYDN